MGSESLHSPCPLGCRPRSWFHLHIRGASPQPPPSPQSLSPLECPTHRPQRHLSNTQSWCLSLAFSVASHGSPLPWDGVHDPQPGFWAFLELAPATLPISLNTPATRKESQLGHTGVSLPVLRKCVCNQETYGWSAFVMASKSHVITIIIASIYWTLYSHPCANPHNSGERYALLIAPFYSWGKGHWQRLILLPSAPIRVTSRVGPRTPMVGFHTTGASLFAGRELAQAYAQVADCSDFCSNSTQFLGSEVGGR